MSQINVFHLVSGLLVGGAETMLLKLLSRMDRGIFRNVVVSMTDGGSIGPAIEKLGVPVHCLGMHRGWPDPRRLGFLWTLLRRQRPDVLQTWMYHADLAGLVAGRLAGLRHIVWNVRCSNVERCSLKTGWTVRACARLSRGPSAVVVNSEAGRAVHLAKGYRPQRWAVIPNGFDLDRFVPDLNARPAVRSELGLGLESVLIGLVGRFDPNKGHDTFLRAAARLQPDHPEAHFVLVGRDVVPSNPDLSRLLRFGPRPEALHLLGERPDIPRLLAAMDVATSSSYGEGFSNAIGEAMACALPCVVTDVGDSAAVVGPTGIVIPPRDPDALARSWRQLLRAGPRERERLGAAGRERIRQCFSLDAIVRRYEDLYNCLATGRSAREAPGAPGPTGHASAPLAR